MTKKQAIEILNATDMRDKNYSPAALTMGAKRVLEALDRAGLFMSEETAAHLDAIETLDAWAAEKKGRRYTLKHYPKAGYTFPEEAPSHWVLNTDDPADPDSEREWGAATPDEARIQAATACRKAGLVRP